MPDGFILGALNNLVEEFVPSLLKPVMNRAKSFDRALSKLSHDSRRS